MKPGRAVTRRNGRTVRSQDVSTAAHTQTGQVYAGAQISAGRYAAYDGQRRHGKTHLSSRDSVSPW